MTDQLEQDIARGNRAKQLLSDELLIGAFTTLKTEYMKRWEECDSRDQDKRERLWWAVRVINEVRNNLQSVVNAGTVSKADLDALMGQKPKRFGII